MRLPGMASPGGSIHAGSGDAFKNDILPLLLSFPRKRESMLTLKGQMDSRLRGNDNF